MSIYLDHQATTPLDPHVLDVMLPFFQVQFGNASSSHAMGKDAAAAVELAREQTASLLGAHPVSLHFTSGATESINLALKGLAASASGKRRRFVTCCTEHPAVLDTLAWLEAQGHPVTLLPVDGEGHLDLDQLRAAVDDETLCVSIMVANNEVGTLHPIAEIAQVAKQAGAFLHTDATQAVGRLPLDVADLDVDLLSFSAHKFYGPKGIGGLYRRLKNPRVRLAAQIHGGGHERGFRSGTLNVPLIVGLGKAAAIAATRLDRDVQHLQAMAERFRAALGDIPHRLNGPEDRLPGNLNLQLTGHSAVALIKATPDLAVSTGSACSSARPGASHVLTAMGLDADAAASSIRVGMGRFTTPSEVDQAAAQIRAAVLSGIARQQADAACTL